MAFVSASANAASSGSVVVTAPASMANGDILVCFICGWNSTPPGAITATGFALWYERACANYRVGIGYKRASGESGDYTFSVASAVEIQAGISVYRGRMASGDPLDVGSDTPYTTSDTIVRGAGITIATAGSDLVWAGFSYGDPLTLTCPGGMNSRVSNDALSSIEMADLENQGAAPTGDKDGAAGSTPITVNKHAFLVALKPAAAAGNPHYYYAQQ